MTRAVAAVLVSVTLAVPLSSEGAEEAEPVVVLGPSVVFSAARASCAGSGLPSARSTQWLLDGAPIAGAASTAYTPPRADDGHLLSCSQTSSAAGSPTVLSAARVVHEQPAQPSWPISPAAASCAAAVCMQEGAGPGAIGEAYAQDNAWWGAQQVRCVSAPWTSVVGDSSLAAVSALAEAHSVRLSLQRLDPSGPVTIAAQELVSLAVPSDGLDGAGGPFAEAIVAPFGQQRFAAGELWSRVFPAAAGQPDWFAPGGGLLVYQLGATARRSFQLTYTLSAGELGARLRCVASAVDGPVSAPTEASFSSAPFAVSASTRCGPRRLAPLTAPQPALIPIGDPRCLRAPSSLSSIGAGLQGISLKGNRLGLALSCNLKGGCSGRLRLTAGRVLSSTRLRLAAGAEQIVQLSLGSDAVRRVRRASHGGLAVAIGLVVPGGVRMLARARIIGR